MKGLEMMFKALGVDIDPAEVKAEYEKAKQAVPVLIELVKGSIASFDARLVAIEKTIWLLTAEIQEVKKLQMLLDPRTTHKYYGNGEWTPCPICEQVHPNKPCPHLESKINA